VKDQLEGISAISAGNSASGFGLAPMPRIYLIFVDNESKIDPGARRVHQVRP
jgi:hypothetical protein